MHTKISFYKMSALGFISFFAKHGIIQVSLYYPIKQYDENVMFLFLKTVKTFPYPS